MLQQMENAGLSDLHIGLDPASGMRAIIAIHSTALGPAIGGCRFIHYDQEEDAITDALRLARGMTYKAALAGLPHGGGKAVLIKPRDDFNRTDMMSAFGRFIHTLKGRYITAMDSGTEVSDMDIIARETPYASCTSASGDPSPHTALGVYEGIQTAVRFALGKDDLRGIHVALQGLGHVGFELAARLHAAGARLTVTDIDSSKVDSCVRSFGADAVSAEAIYGVNCDLFCPCGLGAVLNPETISRLNCRMVAGSANNQLSKNSDGDLLHGRDILYAPDYVINAGGLIHVAMNHAQADKTAIRNKVLTIGQTLNDLFTRAATAQMPVHRVADQQAEVILQQGSTRPSFSCDTA